MALNNLYKAYDMYNINSLKKKQQFTEGNNVKSINNINNAKPSSMNINNVSSQYLENKVMTASPEELTLMLYDGAIRFANKAIMKIKEGNIQEAHNAIIRVQDIYIELMVTLNRDIEVAEDFYKMYDYIYHRLTDANLDKDIDIIEEIISYSKEFRSTWVEAMKLAKQKPKEKEMTESDNG